MEFLIVYLAAFYIVGAVAWISIFTANTLIGYKQKKAFNAKMALCGPIWPLMGIVYLLYMAFFSSNQED